MTGFFLREVRVRGKGMPDATVQFGTGLSLITGPSDTGKSFIADAINHVFGASSALRELTEQASYDRILVEIQVYETGQIFTLAPGWRGGAIELFEAEASECEGTVQPSRILKETHDQSTDSVSGFLLSISGLANRQLRKNESGAKDSLSFRNLPRYTLVEEDRIITKLSPALSGQVTDKTKELSLFRLLLTGLDDTSVIAGPDAKTRTGLSAGRQEVIDSLVADANQRIAATGKTEDALRLELEAVESDLDSHTSFIRRASAEIAEKQERRKALWDLREKLAARAEQVSALLERLTLLDAHYDADIARLQSTQESGRILVQVPEGPCPLSGADPVHHQHAGLLNSDDVDSPVNACEAEEQKVKLLKQELKVTLDQLDEENSQLFD